MRIVLGLGPTLFAANVAHEFRSRGWEALSTATGEDARRYAVANCTSVVLVPYQDNDPLATAKIVNAMPRKTKVVLLTATSNRRAIQLAEMMGIPVVAEAGGVEGVVAAVAGLLPVVK
ncbi:hypothetical protein [Limnoglobus roseus]|uniref:Uncharacterized protein n=1 Tax=Limnoglobus roseus TaxID=2598579 RepID=A0A5C1AM68_9BACT|nr:hypothetical protein [Limnoglobus roseus]QEL18274.1 hypothetical protein PX52LOC_05292 [Limnoglobus roseus]